MIIETVTACSFIDAFRRMDRMDQFSYDGLRALYDYLEQLSDDVGENIELDVVALCCDYAEYDSALEAAKSYGFEPDSEDDSEEQEEAALGWLQDNTTVIEHNSGIIVQSF